MPNSAYSQSLESFLSFRKVWHRFIVFEGSVKTVEEASMKGPADRMAKSMVLI